MAPLKQGTVLIIILGLLFLAPSVGRATFQPNVHTLPGKFLVRVSRLGQKANLGLVENRTGNRGGQIWQKVMLAKAPAASKKKG